MFYTNKRLVLGFMSLCALQIPTINAMNDATQVSNTMKLTPDFRKSLTVQQMDEELKNKNYPKLQKDLYEKISFKTMGTMEWVRYRLDYNKHQDSAFDPFLLYFVIRQGFLKISADNSNILLNEIYEVYKAFFSLAVVACANAYVGMRLGYPVQATKTYNFLMDKLCKNWLITFSENYNALLKLYQYENHTENELVDVIQELKKVTLTKRNNQVIVNEHFLNCLRSGEWIVCSQCGEDNYFYKNTIEFGNADASLRKQYSDQVQLIKETHQEAIIRVMGVLEQLRGTTADKALAFASKKFSDIWQNPVS